jgi:dTDP-glucose 4,6-dehydratase
MTILVTGGSGFIGSNFIRQWLAAESEPVVNLDKLTYAGNSANLVGFQGDPRYRFVKGDIEDRLLVRDVLAAHEISKVVNFAAESHVDRSIAGPEAFIRTNVLGVFVLLEEARAYCEGLPPPLRDRFRFLHISTDEVYGTLRAGDPAFRETTPYAPNSPYSASKAGADHLVRAYHHTYGLPVLTTNCSNNYGPYQFPEKLIPLIILNGLEGKPLPVYGDGMQARDWLYVADHCEAIRLVLARGRVGESYNVGGNSERRNIEVVGDICALLDELVPGSRYCPHERLIKHVEDRPGHDRRYAIDATKIRDELGWKPRASFVSGLHATVAWYLEHRDWCEEVRSGAYREWITRNYAHRSAA